MLVAAVAFGLLLQFFPLNIVVTDLSGREKLRQSILNGAHIDVNTWPTGIYQVLATSGGGKFAAGWFSKK